MLQLRLLLLVSQLVWQKQFAEKGIRVNGVAPGPIWTPLQLDHGQTSGSVT